MNATSLSLLIVSYFALLLVISWITGRRATNAGFFLGNKRSPWYVVAFGMIGASLSGVTFISVPGWVAESQFAYMQMVLGYLLGYAVIANILMPLYYKLNLTSIYTYLENRFGKSSYKTGASFFLLSRTIGAAFRLYLMATVLQITIFESWGIPFWVTVVTTVLLIWLYTFRGGIKTIIWTDTLQTLFMLLSVILTVIFISKALNLNFNGLFKTIRDSGYSKVFFFHDWQDTRFFWKQFLAGAFITIVMTGLDQDMMQKNLSCRNIGEAKKNMYWFSVILVPVNLLFLSLGVLLYLYATQKGLAIPERADELFPVIATQAGLPPIVAMVFMLGLIAAAYSSADSALTALTTSFTVAILNTRSKDEKSLKQTRMIVHIAVSSLLVALILIFREINNQSVISSLFTAAGYTYGPLLGMYAFGLFTRWKVNDQWVPVIAVASPVISYIFSINATEWFNGYQFGFEILILNGLITFLGLLIIRMKKSS